MFLGNGPCSNFGKLSNIQPTAHRAMQNAYVVAMDHETAPNRPDDVRWHVWSPVPFNEKNGNGHISKRGYRNKNAAQAKADYINSLHNPDTHCYFR